MAKTENEVLTSGEKLFSAAVRERLDELAGASLRRFRAARDGTERLRLWQVHQKIFFRAIRELRVKVKAEAESWRGNARNG